MRPRFACPCCEQEGGAARLGRRDAIRGALGLAAAGIAAAALCPASAMAQAVAGGGPRSLSVQRVQTGERFEGAYWREGRYDREAMARLDWLFRDP